MTVTKLTVPDFLRGHALCFAANIACDSSIPGAIFTVISRNDNQATITTRAPEIEGKVERLLNEAANRQLALATAESETGICLRCCGTGRIGDQE